MISTHWSVTVPVASQNTMNGGNGEKEGRNVMEIRKRDMEWINRKDSGRLHDGWYCFLLDIIVSIIPIDHIFCKFGPWKYFEQNTE